MRDRRLFGITLSMTTNFISAVGPGRAICRAQTTGGGRTTKFVDAVLHDALDADNLYASATATVRVVELDE